MNALTLISFVFFTALVAFITWRMTRHDDHQHSTGFFLAGRSLTFPVIAGSLLMTNLSTEQMVGLNGAAFTDGLSVMAWEVVAVVALVAAALFFLPRFLKSGITTIPELLALRFDRTTQLIANVIFMVAYAVILLPSILYSGALGLIGLLDLHTLTGIESTQVLLVGTVIAVGVGGSIYALFGGLRSIAISDTLNGIGLLAGGMLIVYFGLNAVSDGQGVLAGAQRAGGSGGDDAGLRQVCTARPALGAGRREGHRHDALDGGEVCRAGAADTGHRHLRQLYLRPA